MGGIKDRIKDDFDEFKHGRSPLNSFLTAGLSDLARKQQIGSAVFQKTDKIAGLEDKGWKNPFTGEKQGANESAGNIVALIATALSGGYASGLLGGAAGGSAAGAGEAIGSGLSGTLTGTAAPATAEGAIAASPALTGSIGGAYTAPASFALSAPELGGGALVSGASAASPYGAYAGMLGGNTVNTAATGGGFLSGLGNLASDYAVPVGMAALNVGSQYMSAKEQAKAMEAAALANKDLSEDAVENNREWWTTHAYPNQAAVDARAAEARASLGEGLEAAKRRYTEDAAARGLRGGSLAGGLSNLDRGAQTSYAKLANDLIQFQNTPMFTPQGTSLSYAQQPAIPTTGQTMADAANDLTKTYLTYQMYQNMM